MNDTNLTAATPTFHPLRRLNDRASSIFMALVDGLRPSDAKKLDNAPGVFMAVSVDFLLDGRTAASGSRWALYAVAHRYELNGDLVPDPDVEFYVTDDPARPGAKAVYPTVIDHGPLGYHRHVHLDSDGQPVRVAGRGQADLARFCGLWMKNIAAQQRLKVA